MDGIAGIVLVGDLIPDLGTIPSLDGKTHGQYHLGSVTDGTGSTPGTDTTCMTHGTALSILPCFMIHGMEDLDHHFTVVDGG